MVAAAADFAHCKKVKYVALMHHIQDKSTAPQVHSGARARVAARCNAHAAAKGTLCHCTLLSGVMCA